MFKFHVREIWIKPSHCYLSVPIAQIEASLLKQREIWLLSYNKFLTSSSMQSTWMKQSRNLILFWLLKDLVHDIISNLCHLTIDSCNSDEMSSYIIVFLFSIFISPKRVLTTVGFSVLAQDGSTFSFILLLIICGHTK